MDSHSEETQENKPAGPGDAFGAFMGEFGQIDVYAQIVIEEFMEALLNVKE